MKPYERCTTLHEREALRQLYEGLRDEIVVGRLLFFCNIELQNPANQSLAETDLILIATGFMAVIELKHWSGHINLNDDPWTINGRSERPHQGNNHKAKLLSSFAKRLSPAEGNWPRVHSVVVLTNDALQVTGRPSKPGSHDGTLTFTSLRDCVTHVRDALGQSSRHTMAKSSMTAVGQALSRLEAQPAAFDKQFPGYRVDSELRRDDRVIEYLAYAENVLDPGLKRLRDFGPLSDEPAKREQQLRNRNLAGKLPPHPHIGRARLLNLGNRIVEESAWSESGTLRDKLKPAQGRGLPESEATRFLTQILEALAHIHSHDVVHRDLRPENILITGETAQLINFDRASDPDAVQTVMDDAERARLNPYRAPDLAEHNVDGRTDMFAFGVLVFELLTGQKPFQKWENLAGSGGTVTHDWLAKLARWPLWQDIAHDCVQVKRDVRLKAAGALERLGLRRGTSPLAPAVLNRKLEVGEQLGDLEITAVLGEGATAQVYRATKYGGDDHVVIKVFHVETPPDVVSKEFRSNRDANTSVVVRQITRRQLPGDGRDCIEFADVGGESMRQAISQGKRPDEARFRAVAERLLDGLAALHRDVEEDEEARQPLVHNDVNPANIILGNRVGAYLIDLGAASRPGPGLYCGTPNYLAPDLVLGSGELDREPTGDLFALGVSLLEWVTGKHPFGGHQPGIDGTASLTGLPPWAERLKPWFEAMCHLEDSKRPALATLAKRKLVEALDSEFPASHTPTLADEGSGRLSPALGQNMATAYALDDDEEPNMALADDGDETAGASPVAGGARNSDLPPVVPQLDNAGSADWVRYLNSLHNVSATNEKAIAEGQALSTHFAHIHVPLKLTDTLFDLLTAADDCVVVLSGHAGDGKSTIALDLYRRLADLAPEPPLKKPLEPIEVVSRADRRIHIVKDLSEIEAAERLVQFRSAFSEPGTWLIVANTGPLLETFGELARERQGNRDEAESNVLGVLEAPLADQLGDDHRLEGFGKPAWVVNLTRRDNIPMALDLLDRLVAAPRWAGCAGCDVQANCPVVLNATLVRGDAAVRTRIGLAYRRLTDYDKRLTARWLSAHLAYAITGGVECDAVVAAGMGATDHLQSHLFADRFFGFAGPQFDQRTQVLKVVAWLSSLELGSDPSRLVDGNAEQVLPPSLVNALRSAFKPLNRTSRGRQSLRRHAYFFATDHSSKSFDGFRTCFLRSLQLLVLERVLEKPLSRQMQIKIRDGVLNALFEAFTGFSPNLWKKHDKLLITLRREDSNLLQTVQVVVAALRFDDFEIKAEPASRRLQLIYRPAPSVVLNIPLPMLDDIALRRRGEVGDDLSPGLKLRIAAFKARLLAAAPPRGDGAESESQWLTATPEGELQLVTLVKEEGRIHATFDAN